jgi:hypothetical protein
VPLTFKWDNSEKNIVLLSYIGVWSWDEFYTSVDAITAEYSHLDHPVIWMHDYRQSNGMPFGLSAESKSIVQKMGSKAYPTHILIGATLVVRSLIKATLMITGKRLGVEAVFVESVEEGWQLVLRKINKL